MSDETTSKKPRSVIKRDRNRSLKREHRYQAVQRNARISPQKARLAADLVRGKRVEAALDILAFDTSRASDLLRKVLQSAVANASSLGRVDPMDLVVAHACVDEGLTMRRFHARGRGRAGKIVRRSAHITIAVAKSEDN